ncbi:MAG TPA: tripartite tricarboxylate transporter substrate binding protein [Burkholderiales bacterium]|nr:tripartite tricarboxylate transporter substrate binding protein [Burkholderiales bacterium]
MRNMKRVGSSILCGVLFAGMIASSTAAQPVYPERPIRLIIPQATGGGSDTIGRYITQKLGDSLGQQFVVDNRPGAAGMLGADIVRQATPDGYTMLLCAIDTITAPIVSRRAPFDAIRDFAPVTQLTLSPNVWLASASFAGQTMKDLVDIAKAKPKQIDYASSGVGSMQHLGGELLNKMAGIQLNHIPYKGGPPGLVDVLGGRVPVMVSGMQGALPYVKSGKVRGLAVTTKKRFAALSELPTVAEALGLPDYEAVNWQGFLFPAGTPRAVIDRIAGETIKILAAPDTRARLDVLGYAPSGIPPREFAVLMGVEQKRWTAIIREAGITSD